MIEFVPVHCVVLAHGNIRNDREEGERHAWRQGEKTRQRNERGEEDTEKIEKEMYGGNR